MNTAAEAKKTETKYETRAKELQALKEDFGERAKKIVMGSIEEFFKDHEEVIEIAWTQYTPYFNDGEPCTFSVGEAYVKLDPKFLSKDVLEALGEEIEEDEDGDVVDSDQQLDYDTCHMQAIEGLARRQGEAQNSWNAKRRIMTDEEDLLARDFHAINRVLSSVPEVMDMAFGDHVRVSATRDGFTTHEYDHD